MSRACGAHSWSHCPLRASWTRVLHGTILCDPTQHTPLQAKKIGPNPTQPNTTNNWAYREKFHLVELNILVQNSSKTTKKFFTFDVSTSIRGRHQKKLVLGLLLLIAPRTGRRRPSTSFFWWRPLIEVKTSKVKNFLVVFDEFCTSTL